MELSKTFQVENCPMCKGSMIERRKIHTKANVLHCRDCDFEIEVTKSIYVYDNIFAP